jgi:ABC-type multidrug transport system fused ATPase/permease subunit
LNIFKVVTLVHTNWIGRRIANRTKTVLLDEIYKKCLRRVQSSKDDENASDGKILLLMSSDCEKIREFIVVSTPEFLRIPVGLTIATTSLYFLLGWSFFVALLSSVLMIKLTKWCANGITKYQKDYLEISGQRVSLVSEMLQGEIFILGGLLYQKGLSNQRN